MTMNLSVRNYRGIKSADIVIDGITLVAGVNGSGKTSTLLAAQAALTGQAMVGDGIKHKKDGPEAVHHGAKDASARLAGPEGSMSVFWPLCNVEGDRIAPRGSPISAGMVSIIDMPEAERAAVLIKSLNAVPTRDEFFAAMLAAGFKKPAVADAIWKEIESKGWDGAAEVHKATAIGARREWEKKTGERYGSDKAKLWTPKGWREELEQLSIDDLQHIVAERRMLLEQAIASAAVNSANIDMIKAKSDSLCDEMAARDEAAAALQEAVEAHLKASVALDALPGVPDSALPCPHCGAFVQVKVNGPARSLEKAEDVSADEAKKRRTDLATASSTKAGAETTVARAKDALRMAEASVAGAENAGKELATLAAAGAGITKADVDAAKQAVAEAEADLEMYTTVVKTVALAKMVRGENAVVAIVAADGLRKTKLGESINQFNQDTLGPLNAVSGWGAVTLDADLTVSLGGRAYMWLSRSERWRARALIQIALSKLEKAEIVIIDDFDVVVGNAARNGFMEVLVAAGIPALVGLASASVKATPDLGAAGAGVTYWVASGVCVPLAEAKVGVAA